MLAISQRTLHKCSRVLVRTGSDPGFWSVLFESLGRRGGVNLQAASASRNVHVHAKRVLCKLRLNIKCPFAVSRDSEPQMVTRSKKGKDVAEQEDAWEAKGSGDPAAEETQDGNEAHYVTMEVDESGDQAQYTIESDDSEALFLISSLSLSLSLSLALLSLPLPPNSPLSLPLSGMHMVLLTLMVLSCVAVGVPGTQMVLTKELQDLVDVGYSGDQENATVYVQVCVTQTV